MATPISRKPAAPEPAATSRGERRAPRKQLGEFLVEKGLINRDQLRVALRGQLADDPAKAAHLALRLQHFILQALVLSRGVAKLALQLLDAVVGPR